MPLNIFPLISQRLRNRLYGLLVNPDTWLIRYLPNKRRQTNSVLIVRVDAIGDFILWLDSAKEFRRLYPAAKIVLCANSYWASVATQLPYWDQVIALDMERWGQREYRYRFLKSIRDQGFSIAIQPTYSRNGLSDIIIRATESHERIASQGDLSNISTLEKQRNDTWYTKLVPALSGPMMELIRNAEFMRGLGGQEFKAGQPLLERLIDLSAKLTISQPYCVIFPGASHAGRRWPADRFAMVMADLHKTFGWQMVLCGGSAEIELCNMVAKIAGPLVVNLAGRTSLVELVEVIRQAAFVLANETSATHIAGATGTPCVCILGGGHFGRFLPYATERKLERPVPFPVFHQMECFGCNWQCCYETIKGDPYPCIAQISEEEVLKACRRVINNSSGSLVLH